MTKFNENMSEDKKVKEFLKELTELSKKYGIFIAGCGCCGSPYLTGVDGSYNDLYFDKELGKYVIKKSRSDEND